MRLHVTTGALVIALAGAAQASAAPSGFRTPSGNIHCAGFAGIVRCDIRTTTNGRPRRPKSCRFDWGQAYAAKAGWRRGRRLCVSDSVFDGGHRVLAYGRSWTYGRVTCRSRQAGLTCTNSYRHGFFLSRGSQQLF